MENIVVPYVFPLAGLEHPSSQNDLLLKRRSSLMEERGAPSRRDGLCEGSSIRIRKFWDMCDCGKYDHR